MAALLAWIESTSVATSIAGSRGLTGALSAAHLVGLTLLVGSALVRSLRTVGAFLPDTPADDVERSTNRGVAIGCTISVVTGILLWTARASAASENGFFRIKMAMVLAAIVLQVLISARTAGNLAQRASSPRVLHGLASVLWFGIVLAGCAFILIE